MSRGVACYQVHDGYLLQLLVNHRAAPLLSTSFPSQLLHGSQSCVLVPPKNVCVPFSAVTPCLCLSQSVVMSTLCSHYSSIKKCIVNLLIKSFGIRLQPRLRQNLSRHSNLYIQSVLSWGKIVDDVHGVFQSGLNLSFCVTLCQPPLWIPMCLTSMAG